MYNELLLTNDAFYKIFKYRKKQTTIFMCMYCTYMHVVGYDIASFNEAFQKSILDALLLYTEKKKFFFM